MSFDENLRKMVNERLTDSYQGEGGLYWALESGMDEEIRSCIQNEGKMVAREKYGVDDLYPLLLGQSDLTFELTEGYDIIAGPFENAGILALTQAVVLAEKYWRNPEFRKTPPLEYREDRDVQSSNI